MERACLRQRLRPLWMMIAAPAPALGFPVITNEQGTSFRVPKSLIVQPDDEVQRHLSGSP